MPMTLRPAPVNSAPSPIPDGMTAYRSPGVALAVAATLLSLSCRGPGDERSAPPTWDVRFSHVLSSSSEFHLMAERFRDLMRERTGGRFRVVIYPSGQLGGERVAFEQIQAGAVHLAITGTPVLSGWVPEGQMFDLPFLFETRDHGLSVMNGPMGDSWRDLLLERTGVRSLGFLDYGFRHVYNRRRPVEAPEDLAGLKLRVLQNATYLAAYSALGVQATPMNYGEVYSALQQGVIDGGEANAIGFVSSRLYEVASLLQLHLHHLQPDHAPGERAVLPGASPGHPGDRRPLGGGRARLPERSRAPDGGGRAGADARERRRDLAPEPGAVRSRRETARLGRTGRPAAGRRGADRPAGHGGGAHGVRGNARGWGGARMTRRLRALNRVLVALETYAAGGLVITVAVVVLLQVLMRYLVAQPNPWSEEVSRFAFIWVSLLGASLAVEHRAHFGFDQVTQKLAPRAQKAVETFAGGVVLVFALLLIATGIALMHLTMGERSAALNLPIALVYAAVPVSGVLMVIHLLAGRNENSAAKGDHPAKETG